MKTNLSHPRPTFLHAWKLALLVLVAFGSLLQSGCNTTTGVGRDVEAVGRGVERAGSGR